MIDKAKIEWYKDAIIYELHVKTFKDGNSDGIGDFKGLIEKLDHLVELGITAIWLLPFFDSPQKDDGYDIADYYTIHTSYGTLESFKQFLNEAHRRNLKVIIELVLNHTSDQHSWFQRAIHSAPDSPERNFYVWSNDASKYKDVRIIFQDFESSNWSWNETAGQYYWHRFFHHQPDLNFDCEEVQHEIFRIIDYWCKLGVDGFRLDAVPYLFERENTNGENLPETHQFLKKLRSFIDLNFPGTLLLAEANMWPEDAVAYFGKGDECHMNYHFPLMPRMFMAIEMEDKYPIIDIVEQTPAIPESCQWAIFLRNHDELTLEMVTDEERDYMYSAYAKDSKARINLGIRHRLAPLLENNRRKIELMNALLFSMPGTPVIYYGDEIGMGDNFYLGDRNGVRTPMQWSPDRNAGFSSANPQQLYLPIILDPVYHYEALNVEIQRSNTSSLFWYMKRMIAARKRNNVFSRGTLEFVQTDNPKVLAFTRSFQGEHVLVVANLSKFSQQAQVALQKFAGITPVELFSHSAFLPILSDTQYSLTLGPHSFYWLQLSAEKQFESGHELTYLLTDRMEDLFYGYEKERFENNTLLPYLRNATWLVKQNRIILNCIITHHVELDVPNHDSYLLLVRLTYNAGLPELIQIPVIQVSEEEGSMAKTSFPEAIISGITNGKQKCQLLDGYYLKTFQQWLIDQNNRFLSKDRHLSWREHQDADYLREYQQSNNINLIGSFSEQTLSFKIGDNRLLRVFRRIDEGLHPGFEIIDYLNKVKYKHVPTLLDALEFKDINGQFTLGCLYGVTENISSGFTFMQERCHNFIERLLALEDMNSFLDYNDRNFFNIPATEKSDFRTLLGNRGAEMVRMAGKRLAEAHQELAKAKQKNFSSERFSIHYQHSLYSSLRGLSRRAIALLESKTDQLPIWLKIRNLTNNRDVFITMLQRIIKNKLSAQKIRVHGYFDLQHIWITGKDILLADFGGDPAKHLSQRRLKRSPLWDAAMFIHSIFQVTHESFSKSQLLGQQEMERIMPYATIWSHYMSGYFLNEYLQAISGCAAIPADRQSINIMLETYLIEASSSAIIKNAASNPAEVTGSILLLESLLKINKLQ